MPSEARGPRPGNSVQTSEEPLMLKGIGPFVHSRDSGSHTRCTSLVRSRRIEPETSRFVKPQRYHWATRSSRSRLNPFDVASEISAKRGAAPISALWKVKRVFGIGSEKRLRNAVREIHVYLTNVIRDKKKEMTHSKGSSNDLLSRMIMAGLEEEVIRDMMISFIMAGRDTTSAAITWLFHSLSLHPHLEEEVLKEVKLVESRDGSLSSYDRLEEMRFLKACLCETMRLYPPVAWDSKHADIDDLLPDGTPVRAGDRVTYFPYGMGRMESLWGKDRFEFRPDRWFLEPDRKGGLLKKVNPYEYPVFQAGPRVCIGKDLAFIQMKYVVASILSRFEIRPASSGEAVFVPLLTAHMAGGFKVIIRRRKSPEHSVGTT